MMRLKFLKAFRTDESGAAATIFGLAFVPAMLMIGAAVDYQRATVAQSKLRDATSAAAIAVAKQSNLNLQQRQQLALNSIRANLGNDANVLNVSVTATSPSADKFVVAAHGTVPMSIMKIAHFDTVPIGASAGAEMGTMGTVTAGGGCVLSLNDSAVDAIWDNGNAVVGLTDCDMYGNSVNGSALDVSGNATLTARKVSLAGGVHGANKITASQVKTYQPKTPDPYLSVDVPAFSGCAQNNYSTSTDVTLNPGVYCNGLAINSTAKVTLNPGLYVIDRGLFKVNGQAEITGEGVTIVFTSSTGSDWPYAQINGGAKVTLSAPTILQKAAGNTGLQGIVMYGDRAMPITTTFKLNGGSTQSFKGAVYLPEASIWFSGNSTTTSGGTGTTGCMQLVGDTITFIGNTGVAINGCAGYSLGAIGTTTTTTVVARLYR